MIIFFNRRKNPLYLKSFDIAKLGAYIFPFGSNYNMHKDEWELNVFIAH